MHVAWGVLLLSIALRHTTIEACLAELRRNESLRKLMGIESEDAVPRATKKFERLYKGRTAVERVNARLKIFWGADDGNLTGSRRFFALLGGIMVVHAGFATWLAMAPRWEGTLGQTRLSPIAKALHGKLSQPAPPRRPRRRRASRSRAKAWP